MKLRNYLLVCTLLILSATGPFVHAGSDPNKATVHEIHGKWEFIGEKPAACPQTPNANPADPHPNDCFIVNQKSCAKNQGGTLVMSFSDGEERTYRCDPPGIDEACNASHTQKGSCVRNIVPTAIVVGITGKWSKMPAPQPLRFASELYVPKDGLDVTCDEGSLVLEKGGTATAFRCADHRVKVKLASPSVLKRTWTNLALALAAPLIDFVVPVSRGLEPQLNEAVVPLSGNRIDVSAAFQDLDSGNYRVRIESVAGGAKTATTLQVNWTNGTSVSVTIPGVTPGLYKLELLDENGQQIGPDARVLINGPEDFKKNRAAFQEALDATKKWPDEVDARAPRAFLRQVLDGLSRQSAR